MREAKEEVLEMEREAKEELEETGRRSKQVMTQNAMKTTAKAHKKDIHDKLKEKESMSLYDEHVEGKNKKAKATNGYMLPNSQHQPSIGRWK